MMLPSLDIHNDDIFSLHDGLTLLLCWWRSWRRLPPPSAPPILFFSLFVSPSTSLSLLPLSPSFPLVFFSRDFQLLNAILFLPTGPPTQAHKERVRQVSLSVSARICDFLSDCSSFSQNLSWMGLSAITEGFQAVAGAAAVEARTPHAWSERICGSTWTIGTLLNFKRLHAMLALICS